MNQNIKIVLNGQPSERACTISNLQKFLIILADIRLKSTREVKVKCNGLVGILSAAEMSGSEGIFIVKLCGDLKEATASCRLTY